MDDKAYLVIYRKQNEKIIVKELFKDKERAIEILWDKLAEVSSDNVADTNDYDEIYEYIREMLQRESFISVDNGDYTVSKMSNMFLGGKITFIPLGEVLTLHLKWITHPPTIVLGTWGWWLLQTVLKKDFI